MGYHTLPLIYIQYHRLSSYSENSQWSVTRFHTCVSRRTSFRSKHPIFKYIIIYDILTRMSRAILNYFGYIANVSAYSHKVCCCGLLYPRPGSDPPRYLILKFPVFIIFLIVGFQRYLIGIPL